MKSKIILFKLLVGLAVFDCGCSVIPKEKSAQAAVNAVGKIQTEHDREITKSLENFTPPVSVNVSGSNNTATVNVPPVRSQSHTQSRSADDAKSDDAFEQTSSSKIPLGVKLILIAVGLAAIGAVIFFGVKAAKRNSAAAAATFSAADNIIAAQIQRLEERARTATNPSDIAQHNSDLASLEKQRGKLNAI